MQAEEVTPEKSLVFDGIMTNVKKIKACIARFDRELLGATAMATLAATPEKLCTINAGMTVCEAVLAQFEVLVRDTQDKNS